jgi:carbonic anhydrase
MGNGKGSLGTVVVVHHKDCGLLNFNSKFIKEQIKSRTPDLTAEQVEELEKKEFGELGEYVLFPTMSSWEDLVC